MSAEVIVKKRGRPKKVVLDAVEMEIPDTKKSSSRAKSTKASPKTTSKKTVAPAEGAANEKSASKPIRVSTATPNTAPKASPSLRTPLPPKTSKAAPTKTPVTPETSKILSQVRELSAKNSAPPAESSKLTKLSPATTAAEPSLHPSTQPKSAPSQTSIPSKSNTTYSKPYAPPTKAPPLNVPKSEPTPKIPITALNSAIVSNISQRAGARPNTEGSRELPKGYKPVARKVTMAIVALPVAIVTSWVLWQRLVLGEDRKLLVKPGMTLVESRGGEESKRTGEN